MATQSSHSFIPENHKFNRGYTGHEHPDEFDLINMNGRMYDPLLSRFLSPDIVIQSPAFSQSYNRYSYVMNNPLKYTDPSGYFRFHDYWGNGFEVDYTQAGFYNQTAPLSFRSHSDERG